MAWELEIPPDIRKNFEIYTESSPTLHLFGFLSACDPQLTIVKLREALKDIHRNDVIQKLAGLHIFKYFIAELCEYLAELFGYV